MERTGKTNNKALLVMDIQTRIVGMVKNHDALIKNIKKALQHAHNNEIPVIYVAVQFREGFPEVSSQNKSFSAIKTMQGAFANAEQTGIFKEVAPHNNDIIVVKKRVSAFTGSDLEVLLRSLEVKELVLCGIATSGVVLSTIREAADKDYQLTVLSDCCADSDKEVHEVLLTKVFPRQAAVVTVEEWTTHNQ